MLRIIALSAARRAAQLSFIRSLALACLLVSTGLSSVVAAQSDSAVDDLSPTEIHATGEADVDDEAEVEADEGRARIFEGTLAFGMMGQHLRTRVDQRQSFYGPSLDLVGFLGPNWGFLADLAMFFPMRARQIGEGGNVRETYDRNLGFDVILGAGKHIELVEGLTITAGPGVHFNALDLNDEDLVRVNSMTLGVGGVGSMLWTFHNALVVGANARLAVDFVDLIHDTGKLSVGFVWSVGVSAGLQFD